MNLTVLNPLFVSLLPLAAAPILFHLLFRLRKQPRVFSTLMFFHRLDPRLNARRRLREYLILLLRLLLLVALLLALARPSWLGRGKEGSVAMVLVLDNSGSMSGRGREGLPKLNEAVATARTLLARLRPRDSAALVLLVDDPAIPPPPGLSTDLGPLRAVLDRATETEAGGSVARALERAFRLLEASDATRFEVRIVSDLQEEKWRVTPVNLAAPRRGTSVVVHRVASAPVTEANLGVLGVAPPARPLPAGRRAPIEVSLANTTAFDCTARLSWSDDAGHQGAQELAVPRQSAKRIAVTLPPLEPGFHWLSLRIEGDGFPADNRAAAGFWCAEKKPALFLGESETFGQLPLALSPGGEGRFSGVVPAFLPAGALADRLRERSPAFLVLSWEQLLSLSDGPGLSRRRVREFVEAGGSALVVPGVNATDSARPWPEWLTVQPGRFQAPAQGLNWVVLNPGHLLFQDLRDERGDVTLKNVKVLRFAPLRPGPQDIPLAGLEDGRVILAEQRLGRGVLFVSGVALDSRWTTLPLKPGFLAFAQNMALGGASAAASATSVVAGERLPALPANGKPIRVQTLAGSPLDWKGRPADLPGLPRAGMYSITAGEEILRVAVRSSEREGHQQFLDTDELPALGKLAYSVRGAPGAAAAADEDRLLAKSWDLGLPLLLLALAAWFTEGWLANPPPLGRDRPGGPGPVASRGSIPRRERSHAAHVA